MIHTKETFTLYIPLDEKTNKDVDLKDILTALGNEFVTRLTWRVSFLDWFGEGTLPEETDKAPDHAILVSGKPLLALVEKVYQTIEGEFVGFPSEAAAQEFLENYSWFETSSAEIEIRALDNTGFEVSLHSKEEAERIAEHFQEVEWEGSVDHLVH